MDSLSQALRGSCKYRQYLYKERLNEEARFRRSMERQQALHERIMYADEVMQQVSGVHALRLYSAHWRSFTVCPACRRLPPWRSISSLQIPTPVVQTRNGSGCDDVTHANTDLFFLGFFLSRGARRSTAVL